MIVFENVKKEYGSNTIFQDVSLKLRSNRISFFLGKNGTGKTTLIKCLFDLEKYDGKILFGDKKVDDVRNKCCVVWDDTPFYTELNGKRNLYILAGSIKEKSKIMNVARNYLDDSLLNQKVSQYSYGQRKKLMLALVDIIQPDYLIMDEISNGLDYETILLIKKKIKKWSQNMDIILTGHQFEFYNDLIDDLYIIENNNIYLYCENFDKKKIKLEDVYNEKLYTRES